MTATHTIALRAAVPGDLPTLWALRTRAVAQGCAAHYAAPVLDAASGEVDAVFVEPAEHGRGIGALLLAALERMALATGRERLFLSASLNAVPFYRHGGFQAIREEMYPHRSGVAIASVYMEKRIG